MHIEFSSLYSFFLYYKSFYTIHHISICKRGELPRKLSRSSLRVQNGFSRIAMSNRRQAIMRARHQNGICYTLVCNSFKRKKKKKKKTYSNTTPLTPFFEHCTRATNIPKRTSNYDFNKIPPPFSR